MSAEESTSAQGRLSGFIVQSLFQWLALDYVYLVTTAIMIYDHILMLHHEIRFVWQMDGRLGKWLYIATRYLGFISNALSLVGTFQHGLSARACTVIQLSANWTLLAGIGIAQIILYIRTYVIWGQSARIKYLLTSMFLMVFIAGVTDYGFISSRLTYISEPLTVLPGCFGQGRPADIAVDFGLVCLSELVVVVLTVWKCVKHVGFKNPNTILFVLYRDGILFFVCLFGVSVFNIVASILWHPVQMLQSVFHTVLTSRVILHLHIVAAGDDDGYLEGTVSVPVFASASVSSRGGGSDGLGLTS